MKNDAEKIARAKRLVDHAELLMSRYPIGLCREMVLILMDRANQLLNGEIK